jgi:PAS domain S-box-containing protein
MSSANAHPSASAIDYRQAFELAPIGLVISRQRTIIDCNHRLAHMFGAEKDQLIGRSFAILYPSPDEFERMGQRLSALLAGNSHYADNRIMRRVAGRLQGELFWCHVTGQAYDPSQPHAAGIWSFEDLSAQRPVHVKLTPREREVAAQIARGLTAKEAARNLGISHRTVELHRARLLRKYQANNSVELSQKLGMQMYV